MEGIAILLGVLIGTLSAVYVIGVIMKGDWNV